MPTKQEKKKQNKIIEDKTFGLKNKNKSKAVQKYIKGVETTVKFQGQSMAKLEEEEHERKRLRKKAEEEAALLNSLYKDVNKLQDLSDDSGDEDPANTVCPYFKQGLCQKGKKCIYSHDLTLDRTEEIDLYVDQRTQLIMNAIGGKELSELSEEQLGKLLGEKEKEMMKGSRSDIVCKHFLEAVEKDKYGWNWSCPANGDRCKYKHCLPPGYRLKRDQGKVQVEQEINIEQKIDEERNNLLAKNQGNPLVTFDVFMKWKEDRHKRKEAEAKKKKAVEEKKSKQKGQLRTGKELFKYDPTLFIDDEEAADEYEKEEEQEEEEEEKRGEGNMREEEEEGSEGQNRMKEEA